MKYQQLTEKQKYQIEIFFKEEFSLSEIARRIGVHKSAVSREIRRNKDIDSYLAESAQSKTQEHRTNAINADTVFSLKWRYISTGVPNR
ncbi:transposase [Xenorhabdus kozodoii]|uniref:Transposase n=1 Tax=Xenorhabdus kozodoii TaxID=351676 RepID=A0A2D0L210_9GAMM|nr:transposase [Xenorhabdus kozodoii]